jgi:putative transposase
MHRGLNRMRIFEETPDYEVFLEFVRYATRREGLDVHSYVIMSNHYHLQVTPPHESALPRAMQRINTSYTKYFNRKHQRIGTIWGDRHRPVLIESERQWLACLRYIEQNPVRAGIVEQPGDYRWSSYRVHAGDEPSSWLQPHSVYLALGSTSDARRQAYAVLCGTPLSDGELTIQRSPATIAEHPIVAARG